MADQIYYSVFTKQGLALLTQAIQNGTKLGITAMAFGDGGGSLPEPNENFTSLISEVHRTQLNSLAPDPNNANWLRAEAIIASATGGFNIRELGLYAGDILVAYSNYPATYKPNPADGTARIMTFRMILQIDNTANFELVIDPDVVMATIQSVNEAKQEVYKNTVVRVDNVNDLDNLEKWDGRIVYVKEFNAEFVYSNLNWIVNVFSNDYVSTAHFGIVSKDITDDKSQELQKLLDKYDNVLINSYIALNSTVICNKKYQRIIGNANCHIVASTDMSQAYMLSVTGNYITIDGLYMENPLELKSPTGRRQTAISIQAHHVTVQNCKFSKMLHSISTASNGEWFGTSIVGNRAFDCIGVGGGANDAGENSYGEDRGDAFVIWGASGKIINNFAYAKEGEDCRIAFHCEGLPSGHSNKTNDDEKNFIISNNFASGPFRRHFVFEDISKGVISGCVSGGGASWWSLAIIQCTDVVVDNIVINYDRKQSNTAGASWNPSKGAIAMLNWNKRVTLSNIYVDMKDGEDGGYGSGFICQTSTEEGHQQIKLIDINIKQNLNYSNIGFNLTNLSSVELVNCHASNASVAYRHITAGKIIFNGVSSKDCAKHIVCNSSASRVIVNAGLAENISSSVIEINTLAELDIKDLRVEKFTGEYLCNIWNATKLKLTNCISDTTGVVRLNGSISGAYSGKHLIEKNIGFTYAHTVPLAQVTDTASNLNTSYKFLGRLVKVSDGSVYMSTGDSSDAPWLKMQTV